MTLRLTTYRYLYGLWLILVLSGCQPAPAPTATPLPTLPIPAGRLLFTATISGNDEIYLINSDGSALQNLTNDPGEDRSPQWSPDGQHIVFVSKRNGNRDIYMINRDGSGLVNLTNHPAAETQFAWAPNSHQIAFTSDRDGARQLYLMDINEREVHKVRETRDDVLGLAWSPNGAWLLFLSTTPDGRFRSVVKMRSDGSEEINLTKDRASVGYPVWSPDGSQIAFISNERRLYELSINREQNVYLMAADGSNLRKITHDTDAAEIYNQAPRWSPDGRWISYLAEEHHSAAHGTLLTFYNVVNKEKVQIPFQKGGSEYHSAPTWSPDGQWLVFSRNISLVGPQTICFYHLARRHLQCLPELHLVERDPIWEPQPPA